MLKMRFAKLPEEYILKGRITWRREMGNILKYYHVLNIVTLKRDKNVPSTSLLSFPTSYSSNIATIHLLCKVSYSNSERFPLRTRKIFVT